MRPLHSLTLTELAAAIRAGEVSATAATEASLARIEARDSVTNAFISREPEAVLTAAARADAEIARGEVRGPLHGVPLAHKDMFYRRDHVSSCGSRIRRNYVPDVTATVLERLADAGALYVGSLNMSEFAAGPTGHNEHFGHCHNPWHPEHITGGSSSGSGAAVAGRLVWGALGSDTGGSVRLPAAMCGLVGLKPTYGLVSRHGCMPRAWSLDCMGPLARTVADCAQLAEIIAGADARDASTAGSPAPGTVSYLDALEADIRGQRIGVPRNFYPDEVGVEVRAAHDASLEVLERQGAQIMDVTLPDMAPLFSLGDTISKSEAATIHEKWMRSMPEAYGAHTASRVEAGFHIPATRYLEALSLRRRHLDTFLDTVFASVDVVHAPIIGTPVPTIAETDFHGSEGVPEQVAAMTRWTRPVNYLGLPALSVPCGFTESGLPVAFQLIGAPFREALLFSVASAYERATDWHERSPE